VSEETSNTQDQAQDQTKAPEGGRIDPAFFTCVNEYLELTNRQAKQQGLKRISMASLYAASRFNAHVYMANAGARVVAVDLPGFGASPRPDRPPKLSEMVDLIAALLDAEDMAPAVLVGNCMGTNIASTIARRSPESVTAILAVNPLTEASFGGGKIGFLHRMERVAGPPTRALRSLSRKIRPPKPVGSASLRFQLGDKGAALGLHHDPELVACQVRADQLPALVDVLDDMEAYGDLDREGVPAEVPVWIVWGEQNRVLSRRRAAHLADVMHAERVEVLDGTGHLPMLEDPDAVTGLIEDLVEQTATARPEPRS